MSHKIGQVFYEWLVWGVVVLTIAGIVWIVEARFGVR